MTEPPETPRRPVKDTYHGIEVTDPYRWLENAQDAEVQQWLVEQNAVVEARLGNPVPDILEALQAAAADAQFEVTSIQAAGDKLFALATVAPSTRPCLMIFQKREVLDQGVPSHEILWDPMAWDPDGHTTLDWFTPSPDGAYVAASLSKHGSEVGYAHVFEVSTGACIDLGPQVNNGVAGGHLRWCTDGRTFIYTGFQGLKPESETFALYRHTVMEPWEEDVEELGDELPEMPFILGFQHEASTDRMLLRVWSGVTPLGDSYDLFVREKSGRWWQLAGQGDGVSEGCLAPNGDIYLLSRLRSDKGEIRVLPAGSSSLPKATTFVSASERMLGPHRPDRPCLYAFESALLLVVQDVGCSRLHIVSTQDRRENTPHLPEFLTVTHVAPVQGGILVRVASDVKSPVWLHLCLHTGVTQPTALSTRPFVEMLGARVRRTWAPSRDGTLVPVTMILPKDFKRGAPRPCVVTGYGGFGLCLEPRFHPERKVLVDHGFIFAIAHIRGGGELGKSWHREGCRHLKQNVFDDFAGVLDHLVTEGYTTHERLGISGASNGAILMGAMINQYPGKMAAVLSTVGVYDMLRFEAHPNGRLLTGEYGTIADETDFHVLHGYSPVHNVREAGAFPKILLAAGAEDGRVDPMQTAKFGAALQAAGADALIRISANQGHLARSPSEQINEWVEQLTFFMQALAPSPSDAAT